MSGKKIAKVILPIALDREFDYSIPRGAKVRKGMRVLVDFNKKKRLGIAIDLVKESKIPNLKSIIDILDTAVALKEENIRFAKFLAKIYPYTLGEFLFMMIPSYLKKVRKFSPLTKEIDKITKKKKSSVSKPLFVKSDSFLERYKFWKDKVKEALKEGSVLICFPQLSYLEAAKPIIAKDFNQELKVIHSGQNEKELFNNWRNSRQHSLILGTRVSLFYYPADLNLLIVEEENSPYYLQEEKPFHHLLDLAFILAKMKKINLILSADFPTLGTYKLIKEKKISLIERGSHLSNIKVIDMGQHKRKGVISPLLGELLRKNVQEKKQIVVVYNRRGFGSIIRCSSCGYIFKCSHCSTFLKLSLEDKKGICPYCGRAQEIPKICNECNSGYIKSFGVGIDKLGSLLRRFFPEVKIDTWEKRGTNSEIVLATSQILSTLYEKKVFDVGFVLDIDSFLSRLDYEATFNAFTYMMRLSFLFKEVLFVFTNSSEHYLFKTIGQNYTKFYEEELSYRKDLSLPPYGAIAKLTLREKNEFRLLKHAQDLYNKLERKNFDVYGPLKEYPFKLRDKYRYTVIAKSKNNSDLRKAIKEETKDLRSSYLKLAAVIK